MSKFQLMRVMILSVIALLALFDPALSWIENCLSYVVADVSNIKDHIFVIRCYIIFSCLLIGLFELQPAIWIYRGKFLIVTIFLLLFFLGYFVFNRTIHLDEFEHLHTSWKISQGQTPYVDFFQHHHPLLWYLNLPLILIFEDSISTIYAMKCLALLMNLSLAFVTFLISKELTNSRKAGIIAVIILLSFAMYTEKSIENRPDIPQVIFCLLCYYMFLLYQKKKCVTYLIFSGLFWSIGFLFLQKALLFLLPIGLVMIWLTIIKEFNVKSLLIFGVAAITPFFLYLTWHIWEGTLSDYTLFNWVINLDRKNRSVPKHIHIHILSVFHFLCIAVSAFYFILNRNRFHSGKWSLFILSFLTLAAISSTPKPISLHYFLPCLPLFASLIAICDHDMTWASKMWIRPYLLFILLSPVPNMIILSKIYSQDRQLEELSFALKNSNKEETVWDKKLVGNVFRKDLHFFWYSFRNMKNYHQISDHPVYSNLVVNQVDPYDSCSLVVTKKPALIFTRNKEMSPCILERYTTLNHEFGILAPNR